MNTHFKRVLFTRTEIEKKCKELAEWVNEVYKDSKSLLLVGVLKGSVPFLAQLIKDINILLEIDFMTVSSYAGGIKSRGHPKIVMDLDRDIDGKDVLIVEDIVDTGRTLHEIKNILESRNANSIKTIAFLDKKHARVNDFQPDKIGFEIDNVFVVGFGLDVKDKFRNLPEIAEFNTKYLYLY